MSRRKKWLVGSGLCALGALLGLFIAAKVLARRYEPYIRVQAIKYLSERFDSRVELAALRVHLPNGSPLYLLFTRGQGSLVRVEGNGISLRHKNRQDVPPILTIKSFAFDVDLGSLFGSPKRVPTVMLDGVEVSIPPLGQRPSFGKGPGEAADNAAPWVLIEKIAIRDAKLAILPADPTKVPLRFDIHSLVLTSAGPGVAMHYDAALTNPRPPGAVHSTGSFGPWSAEEPGNTPLSGDYTFQKADLGVFSGIAGILNSHGTFEGTLDSLRARGEASVPDFRLTRANNPVPLHTRFEVLVDGTNGNTILQPVHATLGSTRFSTSGGVIKHEGERRRSIRLELSMPHGNLRDLLRLAMKGAPFMEGEVGLQTKIDIPPLSGKIREKLMLDGRFQILNAKFLRSNIQDKIDELSRRGQGQPKNGAIDEVVSGMQGSFQLDDQIMEFRSLRFRVPGAAVDLKGSYNLGADLIDFRGAMRLEAKVSQTQTGWKRWLLKPVDPFFAKNGAGTFLRIKVEGSSKEPTFGIDRSRSQAKTAREMQAPIGQ